ncbi:MAG: hypothetical protein K9M99_13420 [Candidatus Cloacimonetes bacterium]|nr:hypothetical protein [Candidatus Cloacimonadota bacterium]
MNRFLLLLTIFLVSMLFTGCDEATTKANIAPGSPHSPSPAIDAGNVAITVQLQWNCEDEDGDDLTYTVYMGKTTTMQIVASDLTDSFYQTETLDYDQRYYWKVQANDGTDTTMGARWYFETVTEDLPPTVPANPIPANGSTEVSLNQLFRWYSFDADGDLVSYDFYLDTNADPQIFAENLTDDQISIQGLEKHTTYYWKIIAKSRDLQTEGPIWSLETEYGNYPPDIPNSPTPHNAAINVSTHTNLSWVCSDPEGDALSYDIYMGTDADPQLIESGFNALTYDLDDLEPSTTYYWRINVADAENYVEGPIWYFTTGAPNHPPNAPSMPRPEDGSIDESVYAMLRWTCSDPDGDELMYKVYFGLQPVLTESDVIGLGITEQNMDLGILEFNTTYYWKIVAHDGELITNGPTWSFTTEFTN